MSQATAAMIQLAAKLGAQAVQQRQHFDKTIGHVCKTCGGIRPYKLTMNFERNSTILKSESLIDSSAYVIATKYLIGKPRINNSISFTVRLFFFFSC